MVATSGNGATCGGGDGGGDGAVPAGVPVMRCYAWRFPLGTSSQIRNPNPSGEINACSPFPPSSTGGERGSAFRFTRKLQKGTW